MGEPFPGRKELRPGYGQKQGPFPARNEVDPKYSQPAPEPETTPGYDDRSMFDAFGDWFNARFRDPGVDMDKVRERSEHAKEIAANPFPGRMEKQGVKPGVFPGRLERDPIYDRSEPMTKEEIASFGEAPGGASSSAPPVSIGAKTGGKAPAADAPKVSKKDEKTGAAALESPLVQEKAEQGAAGELPPHEQAAFDEMSKALQARDSGYNWGPLMSFADKWFGTETAKHYKAPMRDEDKKIDIAKLKFTMAQRQTALADAEAKRKNDLAVRLQKAQSQGQIEQLKRQAYLEKLKAIEAKTRAAAKGAGGKGAGKSLTGDPTLDQMIKTEGANFAKLAKEKRAKGVAPSVSAAVAHIKSHAAEIRKIKAADGSYPTSEEAMVMAWNDFMKNGYGKDVKTGASAPNESLFDSLFGGGDDSGDDDEE